MVNSCEILVTDIEAAVVAAPEAVAVCYSKCRMALVSLLWRTPSFAPGTGGDHLIVDGWGQLIIVHT